VLPLSLGIAKLQASIVNRLRLRDSMACLGNDVMRVFAAIPAAGHSRRMGQPKLLLSLNGQTVIARLLAALELPAVVAKVVVLRRDDTALRTEVERAGGTPVCPPVDPADMRSSVEAAFAWIQATHHPADDDAWLLAPADHPVLDRDVIATLIRAFETERPRFLVPTCEGRRGHPLLARWDTVPDVLALPKDSGLNALLHRRPDEVRELPVNTATVLCDLDTPEDYERLLSQLTENV
jgi:molybdenum cofactor cytidylyltransferase